MDSPACAAPSLAPTAGRTAPGPRRASRVSLGPGWCLDAGQHGRGPCAVGVGGHARGQVPRPCVCPADVDDCAASPCCQQACTNSPGGYECGCYAGYRLSADGCGCEGERSQGALSGG